MESFHDRFVKLGVILGLVSFLRQQEQHHLCRLLELLGLQNQIFQTCEFEEAVLDPEEGTPAPEIQMIIHDPVHFLQSVDIGPVVRST